MQGNQARAGTRQNNYQSGRYWDERSDLLYYQYLLMMMRCVAAEATSLLDVGTGNSPYMEWFDWIPRKYSVDIIAPYQSQTVQAMRGNILKLDFPEVYDVCTCLQVLEHVSEPERFARRLMELGKLLIVSVPYQWPEGKTEGHVQDPVDLKKLEGWFGRRANYHIRVKELFRSVKDERLIAIFDPHDPDRRFGYSVWRDRRPLG